MNKYVSPEVKIVIIEIEKGFALSTIEPPINKPDEVKHTFNLLKIEDGGRAW